MIRIDTILCPLDFSEASRAELDLAIGLAQRFRSQLVLHHHEDAASPGLTRVWDWKTAGDAPEAKPRAADSRLAELLADLPDDLPAEARISRGAIVPSMLSLAQELSADLIVMTSHGPSTDDHASVAERVCESSPCPVLVVHEDRDFRRALVLVSGSGAAQLLVPTDFSPNGQTAVEYAFALARRLPLRLTLLHVTSVLEATSFAPVDHLVGIPSEDSEDEFRARLRAMVPADLEGRVAIEVEGGTAAEGILRCAQRLQPDAIVMGEHARSLWRRLLTSDTSRQLLHRATCPVWFVPAGYPVE